MNYLHSANTQGVGSRVDTEHYVALVTVALVAFLIFARVGLPTVR